MDRCSMEAEQQIFAISQEKPSIVAQPPTAENSHQHLQRDRKPFARHLRLRACRLNFTTSTRSPRDCGASDLNHSWPDARAIGQNLDRAQTIARNVASSTSCRSGACSGLEMSKAQLNLRLLSIGGGHRGAGGCAPAGCSRGIPGSAKASTPFGQLPLFIDGQANAGLSRCAPSAGG